MENVLIRVSSLYAASPNMTQWVFAANKCSIRVYQNICHSQQETFDLFIVFAVFFRYVDNKMILPINNIYILDTIHIYIKVKFKMMLLSFSLY